MVAHSDQTSHVFRAGDTIKANLTLKPGHEPFLLVSAFLSLVPAPTSWDSNRPSNFNLSAVPTMPALLSTGGDEVLSLSGSVPHQIQGGTYRVTSIVFAIENGPTKTQAIPNGTDGFVITVADDPPRPHDDPVAIGIVLIAEAPSIGVGIVAGSRVRDEQTKQTGIVRRIEPDGMAFVELESTGVTISVHTEELEPVG